MTHLAALHGNGQVQPLLTLRCDLALQLAS